MVLEDLVEANKKASLYCCMASVESLRGIQSNVEANIRHTVLNAKFHEREAEIVPRREGGERSRLQKYGWPWYGYQVG